MEQSSFDSKKDLERALKLFELELRTKSGAAIISVISEFLQPAIDRFVSDQTV